MEGSLKSLIEMLIASQDEHMTKDALVKFARAHGYDRFAYLWIDGLHVRTFNSYPEQWQKKYLDNDYCNIDPVILKAKGTDGMFAWSAQDWLVRGNSQLRLFRDQAIDYGIRSGVTISTDGGFGSTVTLTFASSEARNETALGLDLRHLTRALTIIDCRLPKVAAAKKDRSRLLSAQQHLCLMWTIKGKTAEDIADLIGVRPRTVQHYLATARKKFNANTLPQLVDLAKECGAY